MTLMQILPEAGFGNDLETVVWSVDHASSSISALRARLSTLA